MGERELGGAGVREGEGEREGLRGRAGRSKGGTEGEEEGLVRIEKEARDTGAQEESRRAHGIVRKKEKKEEGGAKEEEEGWDWKRKRGTRVLRRKAGEHTG